MSKSNYLFTRKGYRNYYFKKRVPTDLIEVYAPKTEIVESLRTPDKSIALTRCRVRLVELDHEFNEARKRLSFPNAVSSLAHPVCKTKNCGPALRSVFKAYLAERQLASRSQLEFQTSIDRLLDSIEVSDIPVKEITKEHIREFKKLLVKLPSRRPNKINGMSLREIIKWAEEQPQGLSRLSPSTVNKTIACVSAVLGYAAKVGHIDMNPAQGLNMESAKSNQSARMRTPYTLSDLNKIFSFPIYTDNQRPSAGAGEAAYWFPLLALFTGCRLEELGQLSTENVRHERDIAYLDLTTLEQVKTPSARRRIPIHPQLIQLGFLSYVQEVPNGYLFPDLTVSPDGKRTSAWSKYWGRYARKHGGFDKSKTFHSFRHAFRDACREAEMEQGLSSALMGHKQEGTHEEYGAGYSLRKLSEATRKLEYPGLMVHNCQCP